MSQEAPRRTSLADARAARIHRPEVAAAYEQTRLRPSDEKVDEYPHPRDLTGGRARGLAGQPLTRLPAGRWTGLTRRTNGPGFVLRVHRPARMAAIS